MVRNLAVAHRCCRGSRRLSLRHKSCLYEDQHPARAQMRGVLMSVGATGLYPKGEPQPGGSLKAR